MPSRCFCASALLLLSGCITVYQPLQTLQRPVVVELDKDNFDGVRVAVRCQAGSDITKGESKRLCQKVERVLANQGAVIATAETTQKPDLIVELESRVLHHEVDTLMSLLFGVSLTLIPAVTDTSLSEEVTIRDGDGFVLARDSFQARFVTYMSSVVWAVNGLLDLLVRPPEERLTGKSQQAVVSQDFYSHLSQLAFHARMRALVLQGFERKP
jgi:hypothetical protein